MKNRLEVAKILLKVKNFEKKFGEIIKQKGTVIPSLYVTPSPPYQVRGRL
jgi:hypothetical protein